MNKILLGLNIGGLVVNTGLLIVNHARKVKIKKQQIGTLYLDKSTGIVALNLNDNVAEATEGYYQMKVELKNIKNEDIKGE